MAFTGSVITGMLWLLGPTLACSQDVDAEDDAESPSVILLATGVRLTRASRNQSTPTAREMLAGMEFNNALGWVVKEMNATKNESCGKASFHDLGVTIPEWQRQHPGVDGFCYFENYAWWFADEGLVRDDYGPHGQDTSAWARYPHPICNYSYAGAASGPGGRVEFVNTVIDFENLDSCLDAVDDPYCYTLGWLKGQRLDGTDIHNGTSWREKAVSECDRLQEIFNFLDEEVTVGAHIFGTHVYLQKSVNSFLGKGPPVEARMYALHAYTKCQLGGGGAPNEMAYCYYKGCVDENGRITHGDQCGYDYFW